MLEETQLDARPCRDPSCSGIAEPEIDNDVRYWACPECGYEFGYERLMVTGGDDCAAGVPVELRMSAMHNILEDEEQLEKNREAFRERWGDA